MAQNPQNACIRLHLTLLLELCPIWRGVELVTTDHEIHLPCMETVYFV